jgi:hypothetical protein
MIGMATMAKKRQTRIDALEERIFMLQGLVMQLAGELFVDEDGYGVTFDTLGEIEKAFAPSLTGSRRETGPSDPSSKCHQPQHNLFTCQLRQLRLAYPLKGGGGKSMLAQNLGVKFPVPHRRGDLHGILVQHVPQGVEPRAG